MLTTRSRRLFALVVAAAVGSMPVPARAVAPREAALPAEAVEGACEAPGARDCPDFNGDNFADLAIGHPGEALIPGIWTGGAVTVMYGSAAGLATAGAQFWTQDSLDVEDSIGDEDDFGAALGIADFNGDGFSDLAVGVPGEEVNGLFYAGAVAVLYGSVAGLSATFVPDQFWHRDVPGVLGSVASDDRFGSSLAAGDFDADGFADLAIGVPNQAVGASARAGSVHVLYGSAAGLTDVGDQIWHQNSASVNDVAEADDFFGRALATGLFNNDAFEDLAVGIPLEGVGAASDAGAVAVLYGSASGLSATFVPDQFWTQDSASVNDVAEASDAFGASLAAANFGNGTRDDLAIGVPFEDVGNVSNAGAVSVLYGSPSGLSAANDQFWTQDSGNVNDLAETDDLFGYALAAADFGNGTLGDLAVGVYGEDVVVGSSDHGAVNVLYGTATGLGAANDQFWTQDSPNVDDAAEGGDHFGSALTAAGLGNGSPSDLVIGVPFEDVGNDSDAGAIHVLYGSATGLSASNDQFFVEDTCGSGGVSGLQEYWGSALDARR
jgi:hypothetical protein